jgi:NTE family protein
LRATLEQLVDFDRIKSGQMRFSVGAVNVQTGNFVSFDNASQVIGPEHVIASGSLPPGFPATQVESEYFWDGGLVSNTPLQWVLDSRPRQDILAFQVDLWSARGELPSDLAGAEVRRKEIIYSSRTRAATNHVKRAQKLRMAFANIIKQLPEEMRNQEDVKLLEAEVDDKVCNIVHLIYRSRKYEGIAKDFEFSRRTMEEHWQTGYDDATRTLSHPEVLEPPDRSQGVRTFDFEKNHWE